MGGRKEEEGEKGRSGDGSRLAISCQERKEECLHVKSRLLILSTEVRRRMSATIHSLEQNPECQYFAFLSEHKFRGDEGNGGEKEIDVVGNSQATH